MNNIVEIVNKQVTREEELKTIFNEAFDINDSQPADYNAVAELAVDCALKLAIVIINIRKPKEGLNYLATVNLTVGLNGNPFWTKNQAGLVPLLISAVQAQADYALLMQEKLENPNSTYNDKLIAQSELMSVELFTRILYLLGGPEYLALKSLALKKRLAPYLIN